MLKYFSIAIFVLTPLYLKAQTSISGIINSYYPVDSYSSACNSIELSSVGTLSSGNKVLIIQMQGAISSTANSAAFGDISPSSNMNQAGKYEFNEVLGISGTTIYLKYTLLNTYDIPAGKVQLVYVPQYDGDVNVVGTLTASAWNGASGGVLAFIAVGKVTLNANLEVSGLGFRGGTPNPGNTSTCTATSTYGVASTSTSTGRKGEGVSIVTTNFESGRGKQSNGGGGGVSNNSGGAGGANYGAGGNGGRQAKGCSLSAGYPGIGGLSLSTYYTTAENRIFLGGGGGGGHQNNYTAPGPPTAAGATKGNAGGGIVIIKANELIGNNKSIISSGENYNRNKRATGDSGGGGGAGGAVLLDIPTFTTNVTINVSGGRGDTVYTDVATDLGPGGGGGGGVLWVSGVAASANITSSVDGGTFGASWHFSAGLACNCNWSATAGATGTVLTSLVLPESVTEFTPPCISLSQTAKYFKAYTSSSNKIILQWELYSIDNIEEYRITKSTNGKDYYHLHSAAPKGLIDTWTDFAYEANIVIYYQLEIIKTDHSKVTLIATSTDLLKEEQMVSFAPLPSNDVLNVYFNQEMISPVEIYFYDLNGKELVHRTEENSKIITLTTAHIPAGVYRIKININGTSIVRFILISH